MARAAHTAHKWNEGKPARLPKRETGCTDRLADLTASAPASGQTRLPKRADGLTDRVADLAAFGPALPGQFEAGTAYWTAGLAAFGPALPGQFEAGTAYWIADLAARGPALPGQFEAGRTNRFAYRITRGAARGAARDERSAQPHTRRGDLTPASRAY